MVAQVVDVHAQDDGRTFGLGQRADDVHQLGLAVEAPVGPVGHVVGSVQLGGGDGLPPQPPLLGQRGAVGGLVGGQGRRHRGDGQGPFRAEGVGGHPGQEGRVGATAEGHRHPIEGPQSLAQDVEIGGHDPVPYRVSLG